MKHDDIDRAIAFCEMHECIEIGDPIAASKLSLTYDVPLSLVWAPEDDGVALTDIEHR